MRKYLLPVLLALFVLLDLGYTFVQSYQLPLEGDLPAIVLPSPECRQVLSDPFGWAVLTRNEVYVAPNRFFAHAAMVSYFKSVPFALQRLTDPISSVYAACALFGVLVQALLLYVLGVYISGTYQLTSRGFWVVVALLAPLFQMVGYNDQMGIIDPAITYTFFYGFPMLLLLVLLLPFYRAAYQGQPLRVSWPGRLALVGLMVVLAFNGAIIAGTVAVLFFCIVLHWAVRQWQSGVRFDSGQWLGRVRQLPPLAPVLLGLFAALCVYSLYIGLNERESVGQDLPMWRRYARIPHGILWQYRKLGLPLLTLAVLVNARLIRRLVPATADSQRILRMLRWLGIFAVIYVLLLPLGGYREYRALIIRRDSVIPLLLGLMFFYGLSTYFLLHHLPARPRRWYLGAVVVFSAIFLIADRRMPRTTNACERENLTRLAQAPEPVVRLGAGCTVMAWGNVGAPPESEINAQMLEYWGITRGKKLYYQQGW
ncbi:hypothetical protein [Hymenobacter sp.]|uniref:hypothetical protein n=1 Tax=Hymenobacter sp. TaxID=1898978 RepID=UPI00286C0D75|nr:hypothetical protein [Hymenobacter sp.]